MAIKDDFLEEIQVGDYVEITYGLQNEITTRGVVIKLSDSMVRLQTDSGTPRINLDHLVTFDTPSAPAEGITETSTVSASEKEQGNAPVIAEVRDEAVDQLKKSEAMTVERIVDFKEIKARFADCSQNVKRVIGSITDRFVNLRKTVSLEKIKAEDMLHDLRAKAMNLMLQSPELSEDINHLLASIYFHAEDYEQSEKYYVQANDPFGAAYAAIFGKNYKNLDAHLDRYVVTHEILDPYLYFQYAKSGCTRKSVKAFCACLNNLEQVAVLGEEEERELKLLEGCALIFSEAAHITPFWRVSGDAQSILRGLKEFINALPNEWDKTPGTVSIDTTP